jgi:gliding motility-associated-like protein
MLSGRFSRLFLLVFGLLAAFPTWAKHIIGGEITYEYLGNAGDNAKRWRFTMTIYRDCRPGTGGATFDNPAQMAIYEGTWASNSLFEEFEVYITQQSGIDPVPPDCITNLPDVCVEQATYVFERVLPVQTNPALRYFIVYQRCCRNESITNIIQPGDVGATYYAELTSDAQVNNNNSPVFNEFPPIIICNRFPINFDHSATDVDGDLLVYKFCPPYEGGGRILTAPDLFTCEGAIPTPPCGPPFTPVPFISPLYTPANPMGGDPQIVISTATGLITGSPELIGQYVVGVCVDEYRNGKLLSSTKRDFQFNVADCEPNVLANIQEDSLVGPKRYVKTSCGSKTVTFVNESTKKQFIDNFHWEFDLKNGTTYNNFIDWDATVTFPDTGSYIGRLLLNEGSPCNDTGYIYVNIYPEVVADFEYDYDTCVAGPVVFTDKSYGDAGVKIWQWKFGVPGGNSNEINPQFTYPIPGNHPVRLRVSDKNRCVSIKEKIIEYFPAPPLIIIEPSSFIGCAPADITFTNLSTPIDETYGIVWDFGDKDTLHGIISPSHVYTEPGLYDVAVYITSPIGCFIADTFLNLINVLPSPVADFTCDPMDGLSQFNNTVQFTDKSKFVEHWNWQFDDYGTSIKQNPSFTFPDTGIVRVRLLVTHPEGCQDSLVKYLDIRPEIYWHMPNAFTPNGDSKNDGFFGKGFLEGATDFTMSIWNRWGEKVFETDDHQEAWNGRQMNTGGMSPSGVYVYVVTFTSPRGERREYKGYATLVR